MFHSIRGTLVERGGTHAVLDVHGVCYLVNIPLSTSEALGEAGREVCLLTRLYIREESAQLYGFATDQERRVFDQLILTPGVGPKVALRILSGVSPAELQAAVLNEDLSLLTRVPGIGKKTAERLIVELKEQMRKMPAAAEETDAVRPQAVADAVEALVTLGYKRSQATAAISRISKERKGQRLTLEALIKEALKAI